MSTIDNTYARSKNILNLGENYSIQESSIIDSMGKSKFDICLCGNIVYTVTTEDLVKIADIGDIIATCNEIKVTTNVCGVSICVAMENTIIDDTEIVNNHTSKYISFITPKQIFNFKMSIWSGLSRAMRIFVNL